jgi:ketosteroid isomerase-like protein
MWSNDREFAKDWVAAWNSHDLERILAHYDDDMVLTSPRVKAILGQEDGIVRGKAALRDYFKQGLAKLPDLKFTLKRVFSGVDSLVLEYHTNDGRHGAEFMAFGPNGLVRQVSANYALD